MSVYIKGFEPPTESEEARLVIVFADGHAETMNHKRYACIPVPDHGRLIDADALHKEFERVKVEYFDGGIYDPSRIDGFDWAEACVDDTHTVIPADADKKDRT